MKIRVFVIVLCLTQLARADNMVLGMAIGSASRDSEISNLKERIKDLKRENAKLREIFQMQAQQLGMQGFVFIPPPKQNSCNGMSVKECRDQIRKARGY